MRGVIRELVRTYSIKFYLQSKGRIKVNRRGVYFDTCLIKQASGRAPRTRRIENDFASDLFPSKFGGTSERQVTTYANAYCIPGMVVPAPPDEIDCAELDRSPIRRWNDRVPGCIDGEGSFVTRKTNRSGPALS